jgi:hypothetical protein
MAKNDISPLIIIGIIAIIFLAVYLSKGGTSFSTVGLTSTSNCQDSDNGGDIFWKGTVTGGLSETKQIIATPITDECKSDTQIIEMYCDNGYTKAMVLNCPAGQSCIDGACTGGVPGGAK